MSRLGQTDRSSDASRAQRALVRMLFDPSFAEAVRQRPEEVLPDLDPMLRRQLSTIDDRALRRDRARRRRALGTLFEEWKGATTLALLETRSYAFLERFFESAPFHRAVSERGSMPLAYAAYLAEAIAEGQLVSPLLPDVLALESATAQARRAIKGAPVTQPGSAARDGDLTEDTLVALAEGVLPIVVSAATLPTLQAIERHLFESALLPALSLCDDAPRPALPPLSKERQLLLTVPNDQGAITLVTVDEPLFAVLRCLPSARRIADVIEEASLRGAAVGIDRTSARTLLLELVRDEIVVRVNRG